MQCAINMANCKLVAHQEISTTDVSTSGCAASLRLRICRLRRASMAPSTAGRWTRGATAARPMRRCCRCACLRLSCMLTFKPVSCVLRKEISELRIRAAHIFLRASRARKRLRSRHRHSKSVLITEDQLAASLVQTQPWSTDAIKAIGMTPQVEGAELGRGAARLPAEALWPQLDLLVGDVLAAAAWLAENGEPGALPCDPPCSRVPAIALGRHIPSLGCICSVVDMDLAHNVLPLTHISFPGFLY
jgi:hypothetical protein